MYPKLHLAIDEKEDIKMAKFFVEQGEFIDWFLPEELQYLVDKKFTKTERNKIITAYTSSIFALRKKEITKGVQLTKKQWKNVQNDFFAVVDTLFKGRAWPKGDYTGYTTVYQMYPRNIKNKTFHFPYKETTWDPLSTVAHEMLHFMFFDYIKKRYKIKEGDELAGKHPAYVWQVSETFNTVIEQWQPYKKLFPTLQQSKAYPGCEKMFKAMKKQWAKSQDIEVFLDAWFK